MIDAVRFIHKLLMPALVIGTWLATPLRRAHGQDATADTARRHSGIAGSVIDSLGHPVKQARLLVEGNKASAVSDDSGHFYLRGLPSGKNGFMITKLGYSPVSFEASLIPDTIIVV
ncbi:MAG TPA: carboxypeptidase regulatory-like domain-containing protein, partial [Gemmatimonadaceae bacterium]|nr:carboxypeptidase regulatory-like domain-containing protein [Gemmatimonadaceae bacterium]